MMRAGISLLLFGLVAAVWFLIPTQYSHADTVRSQVDTYSSGSDMDVAPPVENEYEYKHEESQSLGGLPGTVERKSEVERRSDMDVAPPVAPPVENEYQYKSERRSTEVAPPSVTERDQTIIER